MISAWELYLWTRLDILCGLGVGGIILLCLHVFYIPITCDVGWEKVSKWFKLTMTIAILFAMIGALTPSKKDAAMIWIIPQLATVENAELLQGEAAEIYKLAKQALTESLDINETQETK